MPIFLIIFVVIIVFAIIITIKFTKKAKQLSSTQKKNTKKILLQIQKSNSYKEQIVDLDKLYHKILRELGHTGTFGEILKKEPLEIQNLQIVWNLHKLRNTLVHEFNNEKKSFLKNKASEYIREINNFL